MSPLAGFIGQETEKSSIGTDASSSTRAADEHQVSTAPAFTSETDALQMLASALSHLSAADPTQMPAVIQALASTAASPTGFFGR
jgi:hypothetical protein